MDLQTIRSAIRRQTLVAVGDVSDTQLNDIVNEGYRLVALSSRWPWLHTSVQFSTVANQAEYTITSGGDINVSNLMYYDAVVDNDKRSGLLVEISHKYFLSMYGGDPPTGTPATSYYIRGDGANTVLGLVPTPSANEANAYTLWYYKTPTLLSLDTDEPEWTETLHHILIDYGRYRVWEREENFEESRAAFALFVSGLSELRSFYARRGSEAPLIRGDGLRRRNMILDDRIHVPVL